MASFEEITTNLGNTIRQVNEKYGTPYPVCDTENYLEQLNQTQRELFRNKRLESPFNQID